MRRARNTWRPWRGFGGVRARGLGASLALSLTLALAAALAPPAAQAAPDATAWIGPRDAPQLLRLRTTTDLALFAPVIEAFVAAHPGHAVALEEWGSLALYQASRDDCARGSTGESVGDRAGADLILSSAIDLQMKLANDGCALAHRSEQTAGLDPRLNWRDEIFGLSREPVVIVYNRRLLGRDAPRGRFDLIDLMRGAESRLRGRVGTYDIEASGVGYLFAFADSQQATTFGQLMEVFGRGGAVTVCCSSDLIARVAAGDLLVAYNVLGSYALSQAETHPDIAILAPEDYTLILSRAALIPRGAPRPGAGRRMVDFLLSAPGQRALRTAHLIVDMGPSEAAPLILPPDIESNLRPIPLSPALLVGLDQHKRAALIARWRQTFVRDLP